MRLLFLIALLGAVQCWKVVNVDRKIDITSQVVKIVTDYQLESTEAGERTVKITLSKDEYEHLAFISANVDGQKGKLLLKKSANVEKNGFTVFNVDLKSAEKTVKLVVNMKLTKALHPLPEKITQSESQFVVYQGSCYVPSVYPIVDQNTIIKRTTGGKLLSATTPHKKQGDDLVYGPFKNIAAFETKPIRVHYENNSPFVVATRVERTIEVSHWGNIAVEEYVEMVHYGAKLDGPFSRIDHQMDRRGRRSPALQQFTSVLPATARDIYYRDEIGNISTSSVRIRANSVDLVIKPRFPLFGGWKNSYVIGYNVKSEGYLSSADNLYKLKMKLFDHVFDNIVVENLVTKIILPEHVRNIKLVTPYPVERRPDEIKPTYLDITGRVVIVVNKDNVVNDHIQYFNLSYEFDFKDMLREPLMASAFFFVLFLASIIYVRFDFTITKDPCADEVQKNLGALTDFAEKKCKAYEHFIEATGRYKASKDAEIIKEAKTEMQGKVKELNGKIEEIVNKIKSVSEKKAEKAGELLKCDKNIHENVESYINAVEKSSSKSGTPEEQAFANKVKDARSRVESIIASL